MYSLSFYLSESILSSLLKGIFAEYRIFVCKHFKRFHFIVLWLVRFLRTTLIILIFAPFYVMSLFSLATLKIFLFIIVFSNLILMCFYMVSLCLFCWGWTSWIWGLIVCIKLENFSATDVSLDIFSVYPLSVTPNYTLGCLILTQRTFFSPSLFFYASFWIVCIAMLSSMVFSAMFNPIQLF